MKRFTLLIALMFSVTFAFSQTAVDFTATDINGVEHNLFDILDGGQYVCLDFFYTDCSPCTATVPYLNEAYDLFGCNNADIFVMGVSIVWDTDADLIQYWDDNGLQFVGISAIEGGGFDICNAYGVGLTPTYMLIAPDHQIVVQNIDPHDCTQDFIDAFESYGIQQATCTTGVDEIAEEQMSIYPNPTSGSFELKLNHNGNVKVKVVNMLGATIYEENISASGEFTKRINLNGFENGIYFIAIQTGDKTQVKKLRLIN